MRKEVIVLHRRITESKTKSAKWQSDNPKSRKFSRNMPTLRHAERVKHLFCAFAILFSVAALSR